MKVLNRRISWTKEGIVVESDPRHVEEAVKALGLEHAKVAATPRSTDSTAQKKSQEQAQKDGSGSLENDMPDPWPWGRRHRRLQASYAWV